MVILRYNFECIVSFWGRSSGHHVGWNGIIHKLGVYFGQGITPPGQQTCTDTQVYGYNARIFDLDHGPGSLPDLTDHDTAVVQASTH